MGVSPRPAGWGARLSTNLCFSYERHHFFTSSVDGTNAALCFLAVGAAPSSCITVSRNFMNPMEPAHEMAIDEEARRALQSEPLGFLGILLHGGNLFAAVEALIETGGVEFQRGSLLFQLGSLKLLGLKQGIMILPEFTLCARTARGLGGFWSKRVHGKRKVFVNQ